MAEPLPPYRHLPGRTPHPTRDPAGHSFGHPEPPARPFDPACAWDDPAFRRGVELFDAGYYWEAHEAWEGPWRATPRGEPGRTFLQGLIQIAAGLLKLRQGRPDVAARVAGRGLAKLQRCAGPDGAFAGVDCAGLAAAVERRLGGEPDAAPPRIPRR